MSMIVAKLRRQDGAIHEISLPTKGSLFVGRDALGVDDKRCSRKQVQLDVQANGSILLTVLGMNPVFIACTEDEKRKIKQNEKASLQLGDTFYLVANEYPVTLLKNEKKLPVAATAAKASAEVRPPTEEEEDYQQSKPAAAKPRRLLVEDTDEDEGLWGAALKASKKQSQELQQKQSSPVKKPPVKRSTTEDDEALARALAEEEEAAARKAKSSKSSGGGGSGGGSHKKDKKPKRKMEDDYDVFNHSSDEDFVSTKAPSSPKSIVRTRQRDKPTCKYGSKCYRKNPDHIAEFHHPPADSVASDEYD